MAFTKAKILALRMRNGSTEAEALEYWKGFQARRKAHREERRERRADQISELAKKGELCDATQAETVVRFLSHRFGVSMPVLSFTGRNPELGLYTSWTQCITLAPHTRPRCIAHEFAHHLDMSINGWNKEHNESFYFNLKRVVEALGVDYPWGEEYRQVQRWARQDRLLGSEADY